MMPGTRDGLPWNAMDVPPSRRLYAGLVSVVDDDSGSFARELFPAEHVHALRSHGGAVTIDEQLSADAITTTRARRRHWGFAAEWVVAVHVGRRWLRRR